MKKFMSKKTIAILLALVMVIGMLPMTMFATSESNKTQKNWIPAENGFIWWEDANGGDLALLALPETGYELTGMTVEIGKQTYTLKDMTKSGNLYVLPDVLGAFKMMVSNSEGVKKLPFEITVTFGEVAARDFTPEMTAELARMDEIFGTSEGTAANALTNWLNNKSYGNFMNYFNDVAMLIEGDKSPYLTIGYMLDEFFDYADQAAVELYAALENAENEEEEEEILEEIAAFEAEYAEFEQIAAIFVDRVSEPLMVSLLVAESIMKGDDLLAAYTTAEMMMEGGEIGGGMPALYPLFNFVAARYGLEDWTTVTLGDSAEKEELEEEELLPAYYMMANAAAYALEAIGYTVMFSDAGMTMKMMEESGKLPIIPPFFAYSGDALNAQAPASNEVLSAEPQLGFDMGVYIIMMMSIMMGNGAPTGYTNFRNELKAADAAIKDGTFVYQDAAALFEARLDKFLDSIESAGDKAFYRMMGVYFPEIAEEIMGLDSAKEAYEAALAAYKGNSNPDTAGALLDAKENLLMSTIFTDGIKIDPEIREALKGSYRAWLEDQNLDYALTERGTGLHHVTDIGLAKTLADLAEGIVGPGSLTGALKTAYFTVLGEFFYESLAQMSTFLNTVIPNTPEGLMAYRRFFSGGLSFGTSAGGQNDLGQAFMGFDPYFAPMKIVFDTIVEWSVFDPSEEYVLGEDMITLGTTLDPFVCKDFLMNYINSYTGKKFVTSAPAAGDLDAAILVGNHAQEDFPMTGSAMLALAQAYYTSLREQLNPCVTLKSLTPKDGESMWMTVGGQKFLFKFEQKNGGWLISLDKSMIPELEHSPAFLQKEVPGKLKGYYLSMDATTKVGQASLTWTAKEDATVWNYSNGSFYQSVTDSTTSGGFWFLFWYIPFGRSTTTTYYLSTMIPGEKLATKYTAAQPYSLEPISHHTFDKQATPLYNGTHVYTCSVCGDNVILKCKYDEQGFCVCGAVNPDMEDTAIKVTATAGQRTVYGWFWTSYTMHTVTLTVTEGTARKIEYSTDDGKTWRTGSTISSNVKIGEFLVRVTDSVGAIHHYTYTNGTLIGDTCRISLAFKEDGVIEEPIGIALADYPDGKIVRGETVKVSFPYFSAMGGMPMSGNAVSVYVDGEPLELGEEYTVKTVMMDQELMFLAMMLGGGIDNPYVMMVNEITIPGQYVTGNVSIVINTEFSSFIPW